MDRDYDPSRSLASAVLAVIDILVDWSFADSAHPRLGAAGSKLSSKFAMS